jgi:uncharacterized protein YbjQ (UPF0145 family)
MTFDRLVRCRRFHMSPLGRATGCVRGEAFGLTVRSRNVVSQIGASLKSPAGDELKGMTKMLTEGREHATERLVEEAEAKGGNAILAFRYDTSELGTTWTEVCPYGTVVRARKL